MEKISVQPDRTDCISAFLDGDGPYYIAGTPLRETLSPATSSGERLVVSGKVLRKDCTTPAAGVLLDIWHADENGNYLPDWYRGRVRVGKDGTYGFTTIVPKGYGEGTGYRPPHIHFKVWENNSLAVTSEMFFPDVAGRSGFQDTYIMRLKTVRNNQGQEFFGTHDIILP